MSLSWDFGKSPASPSRKRQLGTINAVVADTSYEDEQRRLQQKKEKYTRIAEQRRIIHQGSFEEKQKF